MTRMWIATATGAFVLAARGAVASNSAPPLLPPAGPALRDAASNAVRDPGFESGGFKYWKQCGIVPAAIVSSKSHSGSHSAFEGERCPHRKSMEPPRSANPFQYRSSDAFHFGLSTKRTIRCNTPTKPSHCSIRKGNVLTTLSQTATNSRHWKRQSFDVSTYAGKTVQLQFSVHGNGYSKAFINRYLDDVSLVVGTPTPAPAPSPTAVPGSPIEHVIVVLQENRTFDNMFHGYPGANYANDGPTSTGGRVKMQQVPLMTVWDPSHNYDDWLTEYNGGAMNGFNLEGRDYGGGAPKNFAYSYAKRSDVQPYWDLAKEGVLGDDTFADHRSQSFAGHLYPIAGASGPIDSADPDYYAADNPQGGESCA